MATEELTNGARDASTASRSSIASPTLPTLVRYVPFGRRTSAAGGMQRRFGMLRTSEAAECVEAARLYACGERLSRSTNGSTALAAGRGSCPL